jgi:hypothetical protein
MKYSMFKVYFEGSEKCVTALADHKKFSLNMLFYSPLKILIS